MKKWQKLLLLVLSLSLFACAKNEERSNRQGPTDNVVSTDPVIGVYKFPAMLYGATNDELERKLREFQLVDSLEGLTQEEIENRLLEVDMGAVYNGINFPDQGVKIELILNGVSLKNATDIDPEKMKLNIEIMDSYYVDGQYDGYIKIPFGIDTSTYVEQKVTVNGDQIILEFHDIFGIVTIEGKITSGEFKGTLNFENTNNDFSGQLLNLDFAI